MFRILLLTLAFPICVFAKSPFDKTLPRGLAPNEQPVRLSELAIPSRAPDGPIHSLAEWEEAESVMTLWTNASYVKALTENGRVTLLADDSSAQNEWAQWLGRNQINGSQVEYLIAPTDSIWVRDYGPWYILDGKNQFGIVDTTYNRPRPQDDRVPTYVAQKLGVPLYNPQIVHTGGNYYNDGYDSAFSSTLVFRENNRLSVKDIMDRMLTFLGIKRYTTSPLGEKVTIEHIDTFGKLVSPDTWVFSQFPQSSQFYQDSERMVEILSKMRSAYGTPYKIIRMPMVKRNNWGEDYRAYINSFISNGVLYFPTYGGDAGDRKATEIYQQALPGFKIVGVDNGNTEWGDSVHCRSRNILKKNTVFIFPKVVSKNGSHRIEAQIIPSPGAQLTELPVLQMEKNGRAISLHMASNGDGTYFHELEAEKGDHIRFFIRAEDSTGIKKSAPIRAPEQLIEWTVE